LSGRYPPLQPYRRGYLQVSPLHRVYFEECGNPRGKPAVFLHGGPGGGTSPGARRFFNSRRYRIVLFDQRGCGRSTPHASLIDNTTWHLVSDIEALRVHLGIDRWQVFGGSWGSTLALAYAELVPERVTELVLRGIFLLRRSEIDWFYQNPEGAGSLFPDRWATFVAHIPQRERGDMVAAYHRRLTSRSARVRRAAARVWSQYEAAVSYLQVDEQAIRRYADPDIAAAFARIECHYFIHRGFLERDDQLLRDAVRLRRIPTTIVQGRYDVVCPMRSAWDLKRALPHAELHIVADAGHSALEPGITRELVRATDRYARRAPAPQ
jgi:proline iminopeptidase